MVNYDRAHRHLLLFALRVNTCVELYSGKMVFSSLTSLVSKLERMAVKDTARQLSERVGRTHKSCAERSDAFC